MERQGNRRRYPRAYSDPGRDTNASSSSCMSKTTPNWGKRNGETFDENKGLSIPLLPTSKNIVGTNFDCNISSYGNINYDGSP